MNSNVLIVNEGKRYSAFNLEYPNVVTQGKDAYDAKQKMKEVIADYMMHGELTHEAKQSPPTDFEKYLKSIYQTDYKYIKNYFLAEIDLSSIIRIKDASKAIRTNVSIKKGYKELLKIRKVNLSQFINNALAKEFDTEF